MEPLDVILSRDPAWRPPPAEVEGWIREATRAGAPPALLHEARWWQAWEAGRRGEWDRVTALAGEGLAEPASERESFRLALLHALSGDVAAAQHVLARAVQWRSDGAVLRRFAEACAAEGLAAAAETFRTISGDAARPPSAQRR